MLKVKTLFILALSITLFSACSSNEIGDSKDVAQDKIYQDYSIGYSETNPQTELYCQFRFAGKNGTTLVLNSPSQVQFDGETLKVDSSEGGGAFYRTYKPSAEFFGKHHIIFTSTENKKLENDFSFDGFKLIDLPSSISKKEAYDLNFETTALKADDHIQLMASNTDSSFSITHNANDKGNFITIPAEELKRQKGKILTLEVSLYRTIPLQQNTAEGGSIRIAYDLKPVTIKLTD